MYPRGEREQPHWRRAFLSLGLPTASAAAALALLLVGLALLRAEASITPSAVETDRSLSAQDKPAIAADLQMTTTSALLVATNAEFPPMEYISGTEIVGHDIDLMNAIGAQLSVTVVYTDVAWNEIISGLVAGEYDASISTLTVNPGREEQVDFSLPYVTFGGSEDIAIAVQQGDKALRDEINQALWQLGRDGTLQTIVAAIAADRPDWQPSLPDWPFAFLPAVECSTE